MDDNLPAKRRKVDKQNDGSTGTASNGVTGNIEISPLSVKPDKIQKLRRIAASCESRIQNTKTGDVIVSSVGSSPSSSPNPDNLTYLSTPVDAAELKQRLTALVRAEEDWTQSKSDVPDLRASQDKVQMVDEGTETSAVERPMGKIVSPSLADVNAVPSTHIDEPNAKMPLKSEEFQLLIKTMVSERIKKLEESYYESIIPNLEKKIAQLESENKHLEDRAVRLQNSLVKVLEEYQKQTQKSQKTIGVQVSTEPPPLTPVGTDTKVMTSPPKPAPVVHVIDSIPALLKPTSTSTQVISQGSPGSSTVQTPADPKIGSIPQAQRIVNITSSGVRYAVPVTTVAPGNMYTTMAGQPRPYNGSALKPGSHPNVVVTPRTYQTFARPSGPVTATVYPQPQTLPASLSTVGVPRNSPPSPRKPAQSPPNRFLYTQRTPNAVVRSQVQITADQTSQSNPASSDRRASSLPVPSSTISVRHQTTPASQRGPLHDYQTSTARAQPQKPYQPVPVVNVQQLANNTRHYSPIPGGPHPPRPSMTSPTGSIPSSPRQLIVQNQMDPRAQATYSRPSGPPPLVCAQTPPQPQRQPQLVPTSPRFQAPVQTHSIPPRGHAPQHPANLNSSIVQAQTSASQGRVQSSTVPPRPQVSAPPGIDPTGPRGPSQPSATQAISGTGAPGRPPPAPSVSISSVSNGIVLSWNMSIPEGCAPIDSYQLFAYQNSGQLQHSPSLWKKLGIVKALPLPMACTLTQFMSGSIYHFAVRAIDIHGRAGNYSSPCTISLPAENGTAAAM